MCVCERVFIYQVYTAILFLAILTAYPYESQSFCSTAGMIHT